MNASTSTPPDAIIGGATARPVPLTVLTTPRGKASQSASSSGACSSVPGRGVFMTAVLPMMSAGMSVVYVSLSG